MKTKLYFFLNSPYKWGAGWTASIDEYEVMNENSRKILKDLGFDEVKNSYDVPEGKTVSGESAYMHPMEFVFELKEISLEKVISVVKDNLLPCFNIRQIKKRVCDLNDMNIVWTEIE